MSVSQTHTLSLTYVERLLSGAARQGLSLPALFTHSGLDPERASEPDARITSTELIRLVQEVMRRTGDEFIGLAADSRSKPGTFSMMAHAVINCANLEQAIRRSSAFYGLFETPTVADLVVTQNQGHLTLTLRRDELVGDTIFELMTFVSVRFWSWLVGQRLSPLVIEFAFDAPASAPEFAALFRCPVIYGADHNVIRFPASWLSLPLAQTPLSLSRFLKDSLAQIIAGRSRPMGLAEQVRNRLSSDYGHEFPDLPELCATLSMTPQTLRRRLKEESTSYQAIKDQLREEAARFYLAKPALSIDEIALMMGFSEASAFHRAFKKWTGQTPSSCRRHLLGLPE
ncbi:MAG: AraC family transcriptional regulator [Paraperlucidibaca sp.]